MEKQRFGQISLPKITNKLDYPYIVIVDTGTFLEDTDLKIYWLCYSNQPFYTGKFNHVVTGVETEGIAFNVSSSILLYQGLSEGVGWSQIEPSYDKTATWILVGTYENYIWASHALTDKDTGNVKFEYYEPTLISNAAEQPQVSQLTQSVTYEIFDIANEIICPANSVDNGELTYKWYERGLGLVSSYNFFTPTTYITKEENGELIATTGSKEYYCVVINSKNNTQTASIVSAVLTITAPTPELYNNFNFNLGWLLGNYSKRLSIADETKPLIDLDFKNYIKNTSSIPNKGTSGARNNAKVTLNSGEVYYENDGLVLTNNANFIINTDWLFTLYNLKIGPNFTWMIQLKDFVPSEAAYDRVCLAEEDLFTVFYYNYAQKFCAKLHTRPSPSIENEDQYTFFKRNPELVSYDENKGYTFDLNKNDIITFVQNNEYAILYINDKWAMKMGTMNVFSSSGDFVEEKIITKFGCGDITGTSGYNFEKLKIGRFLYYDKVLNKSQIGYVIDNLERINKTSTPDNEIEDDDNISDVYDNEWPIEWSTIATANNSVVGNYSGFKLIKISNLLTNYGTETLSVIATVDGVSNELPCVKVDSSNEPEFGVSIFYINNNDKLAVLYLFYCALSINGDEITLPESGTYCFMVDVSTGLEIPFDSIDLQMKLLLSESTAQLENGILYIKNADATQDGEILEVK